MKRNPTKYTAGPGGIKCDCCRIGTLKEARTRANQIERRKNKQKLKTFSKKIVD